MKLGQLLLVMYYERPSPSVVASVVSIVSGVVCEVMLSVLSVASTDPVVDPVDLIRLANGQDTIRMPLTATLE